MELVFVILFAAAVLGLCWLVDTGFTKIFRSQPQHMSGLSVRLNKRYATIGIILTMLGLATVIFSISENTALLIGGIVILLLGAGLVTYYMTFGIFYDDDGFILTTFGRKSRLYRYQDISHQQLYMVTGGNITVDLYLTDGRSVMLHNYMPDADKFLDHAFRLWCAQTGRDPENCDFHDPANSLWFPAKEE